MKISNTKPENWAEIEKKLGVKWEDNLIFAFGDIIHTPRQELLPDVVIHEQVHKKQQGAYPATWWTMYLNDREFRLSQEKEAYLEQARFIKKYILDRNACYKCLSEVAQDFASPHYGNIISYEEAMKLFLK